MVPLLPNLGLAVTVPQYMFVVGPAMCVRASKCKITQTTTLLEHGQSLCNFLLGSDVFEEK